MSATNQHKKPAIHNAMWPEVGGFPAAVDGGKPTAPTSCDALATDTVTEAVLKSAKSELWVKIPAA